jgi:hypothetical protein
MPQWAFLSAKHASESWLQPRRNVRPVCCKYAVQVRGLESVVFFLLRIPLSKAF